MRRAACVLVVDDDPAIRKIVGDRFRALGYEVALAADGHDALSMVDAHDPDVVLLDLQMPGMDGFEVLAALQRRAAPPPVVVLTAHGSIEAAVRAVRAGAADLLTKPFDAAHLEHVVATVIDRAGMRRRIERLETEIGARHALVCAPSGAMREAYELSLRAAATESTVLLQGESGTGKEVLARAIHGASRRKHGPFVALSCAVLGAELLESELFGHERGAFTGAIRSKPGKIELAAQGTLFLDEIGELLPALQAKLLRVLQEREFERVGGTRTLDADVRVIAATNRELRTEVAQGRFRQDLYYRLDVVSVRVPPLRSRPEDILPLAQHFLAKHAAAAGRRGLTLSARAEAALVRHPWPGNVRELSNVIERAVVLASAEHLDLEDLGEELAPAPPSAPEPGAAETAAGARGYHEQVAEAKRAVIREALRRTGGHQTRAAEQLGLSQPYLARLMKNLGLRGP